MHWYRRGFYFFKKLIKKVAVEGRLVKAGAFEFYYAGNEVIAFSYGGEKYVYCKDVFGNITAILDGSGNVVVKYDYDAWGAHKIKST